MVRAEVLRTRLEKLDEYLCILKGLQQHGLAEFLADPVLHGAAERYLHLAIECLLDLGNHLIVDRRWRKPETYAEVLVILEEQGQIPPALARQLDGLAAFRNLLVHDYARLDRTRVHAILQTELPALEELGRIFLGLL